MFEGIGGYLREFRVYFRNRLKPFASTRKLFADFSKVLGSLYLILEIVCGRALGGFLQIGAD